MCPFLRYRKSRRRITGDSMRGTASIKSFNQFGVFFPPHQIIYMTFGYFSPAETIPLTNLAHVSELYETALTADAATNFTATPRLSWTDTPDDVQRLNLQWFWCFTKLQEWAQSSVVTIDRNIYRGHVFDQPPHDHPELCDKPRVRS
ncbi:hypothetical protein A5739_08805 [Mycobacterium colombiense]|uniref:hypothetical protein n=1 Tax=Mycobacterium colombiense TaxID=339268 RepID=UPI00096BF5CB|nr:hypothetical protein [Mycobacterium colombiense]OMC33430.1 hypothetical protein A5739_08805 [Mycobacterium colombiense]